MKIILAEEQGFFHEVYRLQVLIAGFAFKSWWGKMMVIAGVCQLLINNKIDALSRPAAFLI